MFLVAAYFVIGALIVIAVVIDEIMDGADLRMPFPREMGRITGILLVWPIWVVIILGKKIGEWTSRS